MSSSEQELLTRLVALQEESVRLQRAALVPQLRRLATELLVKGAQRAAYDALDGQRTMRDVSADSGVALGTLGRWVAGWRQAGLVFDNAFGRVEHLMSLGALGID